jgi:hypothetical protein
LNSFKPFKSFNRFAPFKTLRYFVGRRLNIGVEPRSFQAKRFEGFERLKRLNPDSAVGSIEKGNVAPFHREVDGLLRLSRQRARVPE